MERFPCNSKLILCVLLAERKLELTLEHRHHQTYTDIQLSPDVLDFINDRIMTRTPSEIYRDLLAAGIPGSRTVAQHQVYYQWLKANSKTWRRDDDEFTSVTCLLTDAADKYRHETFTSGDARGFAFYILASASLSSAMELAIDATYGTNSTGMELYAVLAEADGAGVPLAYFFVESTDAQKKKNKGALTHLLDQFLQSLKTSGFDPAFVGCDKDLSEIAAIRQVWPKTTVQLCFWHAKRAVRAKLKDSSKTKTQSHYFPADAQQLIPDLEICWGSHGIRRPDGAHRYSTCDCESRSVKFEEQGRLEISDTKERDVVLDIFARHFNAHPLIPDRNGTYRTPVQIHRECTAEIYAWCRARNYFRLWAYLWINWYKPGQWELWARSVNASEIPVLKTTMIVESHWRKIKHDYLHRFNRPRIDLVVWILTNAVIPAEIDRMRAISSGNDRIASASWRKAFKKEWKTLINRPVEPQNVQRYHTDPRKWTCSCDAFVLSRFLICKHILHCYVDISDPISFFSRVLRHRSSPF
jgi:hypothetical protein